MEMALAELESFARIRASSPLPEGVKLRAGRTDAEPYPADTPPVDEDQELLDGP